LAHGELKDTAELRLGQAQRLPHAFDGIGHGNTMTLDVLVQLAPSFAEIICGRWLGAGHEQVNLSQLGNGTSKICAPARRPLDDLSVHAAFRGQIGQRAQDLRFRCQNGLEVVGWCRATIRVRTRDNQGEKVVARLAS
jgi:hypothetical protein